MNMPRGWCVDGSGDIKVEIFRPLFNITAYSVPQVNFCVKWVGAHEVRSGGSDDSSNTDRRKIPGEHFIITATGLGPCLSTGTIHIEDYTTHRNVDNIVVEGGGGHQPCDDTGNKPCNGTPDASPLVRLFPRDCQRNRHDRASQDDSHECLQKEMN